MSAPFNSPSHFDRTAGRWSDLGDAATGGQPRRPALGDEIRQITRIFRERWLLVLGTVAAVLLCMLAFIWSTTPLYQAEVELLIDPRQKQTLEREVAPTGLGSSAVGADTLLLDSQIEVIRSNSTIERLVREAGLLDDPEFVGAESSPLIRQIKDLIKGVVFGPHEATWKRTSAYDRAVQTLFERLSIERERNTYVISLKMLSADADKAAAIVTRLADIYIQQTNAAASSSTRDTAENLDARLDQLRLAAQAAAEKVETYKRDKNLIGAQEVLVVEQQLRELNAQLGQAQVETQTTKALLNQVKAAGKVEGGRAVTSVVQSPVLSELQLRMAEVDAEEADLALTHGPRHPAFQRLKEKRAAVLASIQAEYRRILNRLEVSYDSAVEKQTALQAQVNDLEGRMASSNADSVMLRELEREADASRSVYETYLTRSKQVREQIDLPTSTARVISAATPASRPAYPRVPLLLGAALAIGLLAGLGLAWLSYVLGHDGPSLRRRRRLAQPARQPAAQSWPVPSATLWQPATQASPALQPASQTRHSVSRQPGEQPASLAEQLPQAPAAPARQTSEPAQPAFRAAGAAHPMMRDIPQPARSTPPPAGEPAEPARSAAARPAAEPARPAAEPAGPAAEPAGSAAPPGPAFAPLRPRPAVAVEPPPPALPGPAQPATPVRSAIAPRNPAAAVAPVAPAPAAPAMAAQQAPSAPARQRPAGGPAASSRLQARYIGPYAVAAREPAQPARGPAHPGPRRARSLLSFGRQPGA